VSCIFRIPGWLLVFFLLLGDCFLVLLQSFDAVAAWRSNKRRAKKVVEEAGAMIERPLFSLSFVGGKIVRVRIVSRTTVAKKENSDFPVARVIKILLQCESTCTSELGDGMAAALSITQLCHCI